MKKNQGPINYDKTITAFWESVMNYIEQRIKTAKSKEQRDVLKKMYDKSMRYFNVVPMCEHSKYARGANTAAGVKPEDIGWDDYGYAIDCNVNSDLFMVYAKDGLCDNRVYIAWRDVVNAIGEFYKERANKRLYMDDVEKNLKLAMNKWHYRISTNKLKWLTSVFEPKDVHLVRDGNVR